MTPRLCSSTCIALSFMYGLLDPSVHSVAFSVDDLGLIAINGGDTYHEGARHVNEQRRGVLSTLPHLRQPVRPETERRKAIRQTVPMKAPVETKTSTVINKRLSI